MNVGSPYRRIVLVTIAHATIAALFIERLSRQTLWSPDSNLKYLQVQSLRIVGGTLRFDVPYPGARWDPEHTFVPLGPTFYQLVHGEIHIVWPLTFALLVWPFFRMLGFVGLYVVPILSGAGTVYLTGRIAEKITPGRGFWAALIVATTPLLTYSCLVWEHTLATFLSVAGAWLLLTPDDASKMRRLLFFGGALIGAAAAALRADLYTFVVAICLAAVWFRTERAFASVALLAGVVSGSAPFWAINFASAGHVLPLNAAKNFTTVSTAYLAPHWRDVVPDFIAGRDLNVPTAWGFTLLVLALIVLGMTRTMSTRLRFLHAVLLMLGLVAFSICARSELFGRMLVDYHGALVGCPLLAAFAWRSQGHEPTNRAFLMATLVGYVALYLPALCLTTPLGPAGGGLELGPRFLLTAYPLASILVATIRIPDEAPRLAIGAGVALSLAVGVSFQASSLRVVRDASRDVEEDVQRVRATGDQPVVTDLWWFPISDTVSLVRRPTFVVHDEAELGDLMASFERARTTRFTLVSFIRPEDHPALHDERDCRRLSTRETPGRLSIYVVECRPLP